MLKNNFLEIITQKGIKITKVSKDTGISRTTLTALAYNTGKGIQFDTLDTLCGYLNILPTEFFSYIPINLSFDLIDFVFLEEFDEQDAQLLKGIFYINIYDHKNNLRDVFKFNLNGSYSVDYDGSELYFFDFLYTENDIKKMSAYVPFFAPKWFKIIINDLETYLLDELNKKTTQKKEILTTIADFFNDACFKQNFDIII